MKKARQQAIIDELDTIKGKHQSITKYIDAARKTAENTPDNKGTIAAELVSYRNELTLMNRNIAAIMKMLAASYNVN